MKQAVLSTFTGAGLLDRGFEEEGFFVASLGDVLLGHDIRKKKVMPGLFNGLIGGPPCQWASRAKGSMESPAINLIPEYLRVFDEGRFDWAVMENVDEPQTREFMDTVAPDWDSVSLRDWDCGGYTARIRRFWFKGLPAPSQPPKRPGKPALSVLATSWTHRAHKTSVHSALDPNNAAHLQGYPMLAHQLICAFPESINNQSKHRFSIHLLGNGVPHAMSLYIARWIKEWV